MAPSQHHSPCDHMSGSTLFTKIIEGEIPCYKLYENEHVFAFLDINPLSKGHTLLIPKEPAPTIDQLTQDSAAAIGKALPILSRAIKEATGAIAYNIIQNNGKEAGMTVPHVHFHIIPRYPESKHTFTWKPKSLDVSEGRTIADAIQLSLSE